jgi:hypothetical protein
MHCIVFNFFRVIFSSLILILFAAVAQAQFKASVEGTVTDQNGAVVTGAAVTLTSDETGRTLQTTTGNEGFYRFGSLAPGRYTITADKPGAGFNKVTIPGVVVNAEGTQGVNITLTAGVSESVTVTADNASALQTENPNITRAISTEEVRELPQFGRDPYNLLRLTPGVFGAGARSGSGGAVNLPNTTGPGGSNNAIFQTENQVPITANGQRLSDNNFQIDGVSVNSFNWGGAALVTPNQESVKEIRVKSSTYSAEDGRNSGAQIQVVSQNGTNDFHGSLFIKYNSPKLNAFNKYGGLNGAPPVRVQDYIRQFGGSLGGPLPLPHFGEGGPATIWGKNKSFFFFSYEGLRNNTTNFGTAYVETPQYRQLVQQLRPGSNTAQVFAALGIAPRTLNVIPIDCRAFGNDPTRCRVVAGGLDIGSPTGARGQYTSFMGGGFDNIPDLQFIQFFAPNQNRGNQYNARFDFTPNEKDAIAFSTYVTRLNNLSSDPSAQARPIADLPFKPLNTSATITYNRILSPTTYNEARFNATRFFENQFADATNTNFGIPRIEVEGFPFDRIRFGAPQGEGTPAQFAQNIFEFSDTLNKVFGNHGAKFGFVYRNEQDNSNLSGGSRPLYSFTGLFNLANDTPVFEQINADPRTGLPADAQRYFRTKYYAGFMQDDWKARPNLTLNLGLRYEYFTPLIEKQGRLSNIFFPAPGDLAHAQVSPVTRQYDPDRNNFAPRLGFAYSPTPKPFGNLFSNFFKENKAVIRGGFGIAYNRIPVAPLNNARGNPPFFARYGLCCGTTGSPFAGGTILYTLGTSNSPLSYPSNPALAKGINPTTGGAQSGPVEIYGTPQKLPNSYVYIYSLEFEYDLPYALTATIGYQGSAGHKLIRLVNQNFLYPNNPSFFAVYFPLPDSNSNFNALNLELARRFSKGFQLQANYRWSKSIDENSYEGPGFVTNQTYPQNNRTERGPSDYDVRHYLTVSSVYELPFYKGRNDFAGKVLGGFLVSGILTYHTGFPWTPVVGGCTSTPGGPQLCPVRPQGYTGPAHPDTSNRAFITGSNFPGGGAPYFIVFKQADGTIAPPGIGRNSFRGPNYFDIDMSIVKQIRLGGIFHLGEGANLELRANAFNVFNKLNLAPFGFSTSSTTVGYYDPNGNGGKGVLNNNPDFGKATAALAGRVVELQARFRF